MGTRRRRAAVPLWVGLVVFVSLVFDHSVAADAYVRPGHLHPVQRDPERHRGGRGGQRGKSSERGGEEQSVRSEAPLREQDGPIHRSITRFSIICSSSMRASQEREEFQRVKADWDHVIDTEGALLRQHTD